MIFITFAKNKRKMNDTWNEICFELRTCIQNNVLEKEYENAICNCMMLLGWKKFRGEIVTQYSVQTGHENKYADIVILQDNIERFVIEVKRPNHILQEEDEKQLFSYMRLLKHQVTFGLYIGDKIRLYYDEATSRQLPEQVFSIDIEENNPDGIKFIELFSKDLFNVQNLTDFCQKQKEAFQERKQIQDEINKLLSDTNGQVFKEMLKKKYLNEGHSNEWADSVLDKINLIVSPVMKEPVMREINRIATILPVQSTYYSEQPRNPHDKTKYGFLGSGPLAKRKFVWSVIKHFVNENPKTYNEYAQILNSLKPDAQGVIKTYDSLSQMQMIRYFTKENECLRSIDGVKFVVCNQWGDFNIKPIVEFANLQGYNVIEYK